MLFRSSGPHCGGRIPLSGRFLGLRVQIGRLPAEVVVGDVHRNCRFQIGQFLGERQSQPAEPLHELACSAVEPLDVTRAYRHQVLHELHCATIGIHQVGRRKLGHYPIFRRDAPEVRTDAALIMIEARLSVPISLSRNSHEISPVRTNGD